MSDRFSAHADRFVSLNEIGQVLAKARDVAVEYYRLTGKPLGITGEIGEYVAASRLGLDLSEARTAGLDATDGAGRRIQIKARCVADDKRLGGQRMGSIKLDHQWDAVVLVIMNQLFEPQAIYEAERDAIEKALKAPGSKARNERGALSISKFISIGRQVWPQSPAP